MTLAALPARSEGRVLLKGTTIKGIAMDEVGQEAPVALTLEANAFLLTREQVDRINQDKKALEFCQAEQLVCPEAPAATETDSMLQDLGWPGVITAGAIGVGVAFVLGVVVGAKAIK